MHGIQLISINADLISPLPTLSPISFWQSFPLYTLKNIAFHMESRSKINVDLFFFLPFNIMASRPRLILPYGLFLYKTEKKTDIFVVLSILHKAQLIWSIFIMNFLVRILLYILPLKCASFSISFAFLDTSLKSYIDVFGSHLSFFLFQGIIYD